MSNIYHELKLPCINKQQGNFLYLIIMTRITIINFDANLESISKTFKFHFYADKIKASMRKEWPI
uniref:Uncharacterized protein n=1 Tax=Rhizophora mucronata TaxID=61149 RepID=A0A2P2IJJ6_RHIMU